MKTFYTSDNHFGHKNIILPTYCNRPFADVAEMGRVMIERWNAVVRPEDTVYHLGDLGFGSKSQLTDIVKSLNGHKIIIKGNHDRGLESLIKMGFESAGHSMELDDGGLHWLLIHNPYGVTSHKNILCGHVHTRWARKGNVINVGVDVRDFTPRTIDELLATPQSLGKAMTEHAEDDRIKRAGEMA